MKKTITYLLFLIFILLILWVFIPVSEGLVVKMRTSKNGIVSRSIFYIQKNQLKIVTDNKSLIFSHDQLCLLDNSYKTYWKGTVKEFGEKLLLLRNLSEGSPYFSRSELFYQNLSEEDKLTFKRILNANIGMEIEENDNCEISKTPNFTPIAGYASRKYEIRQAGIIVEEIWISDNLKSYLNNELNIELYHDFMRSYLNHSESKLYNHLGSFMELVKKGFPMKIKMYQDGLVTETFVENLIKRDIKNSIFYIPEGYNKSTLEEVLK